VFTLVFLKCAHYSTDFGTRMKKESIFLFMDCYHLKDFPELGLKICFYIAFKEML